MSGPEAVPEMDDYEKKKKAAVEALKTIGKTNKLAAEAAKREMPGKSNDEACRVMSALYYAAEENYRKGVTSLHETIQELCDALQAYAGKHKAKKGDGELMEQMTRERV